MSASPEDIAACWPGVGEIAQIELSDGGLITVGKHGCTRLEKFAKAGEHAFIPYVRVWKADRVAGEFLQHKLASVVFT